MSLSRLFKRLANEEMGFFSMYERNYKYIFMSPEKLGEHYLAKRFTNWKRESLEKSFPLKKDDRGRDYIFSYGRSMTCLLESNFENYPVTNGFALVPKSLCAKCPHRGKFRRKYFCELIREKNRGLTKQLVTKAVKTAEEILR